MLQPLRAHQHQAAQDQHSRYDKAQQGVIEDADERGDEKTSARRGGQNQAGQFHSRERWAKPNTNRPKPIAKGSTGHNNTQAAHKPVEWQKASTRPLTPISSRAERAYRSLRASL